MALPERSRGPACVSDLALDRHLAGDLSPSDERTVRGHLDACEVCRARHRQIEEGAERFRASAPPLPVVPMRRPRLRWRTVAGGLLAAAAAGLIVLRVSSPTPPIRAKGSPGIGFYVSHRGQVRLGGPGELVRPGDRLRFTYSTDTDCYLALVSVDAAGVVSVYFPSREEPARVRAGRNRPLPVATLLDATSGRERVIAAFCDQPVRPGRLRAAIERLGPDTPLPEGCRRAEISFVKGSDAP